MKRRGVWFAGATALVLGGVVVGPVALRQLAFFGVRRVELVGTRYLAPEQLVARLGLAPDQNLFDDTGEIARRVERVGGVVSARVERRLPGTLRITVVERVPVAFAPGPNGLVPLDAAGQALPYDPAATGLALPVVPRADSLVLGALAQVRAADSALYQDVDAAQRGEAGAVLLELGPRRVMLRGRPTIDAVQAVAAVRRHLAASGRPYAELDARFEGWVVARRSRS
ncbi:MAG: FtsQ-type POTRA domain-containing protein [Gemmatimonadetes bacterium]|nr:FtsQ-type POTRA domain-containing protein [Gemmatimonadota bacterium]